jgi:hypothetical protein
MDLEPWFHFRTSLWACIHVTSSSLFHTGKLPNRMGAGRYPLANHLLTVGIETFSSLATSFFLSVSIASTSLALYHWVSWRVNGFLSTARTMTHGVKE